MSGFNLDDYVDVAERIRLFYERYPDGRLQTFEQGYFTAASGQEFVYIKAKAYRAAEDDKPCIGTAWEPIPGPTPYTKDSELMNAETAAWGRAIIAAGIPSKKIASAEEVQARRQPNARSASTASDNGEVATPAQMRKLHAVLKELGDSAEPLPEGYPDWTIYSKNWIEDRFGKKSRADLTKKEMSELINELETQRVPF